LLIFSLRQSIYRRRAEMAQDKVRGDLGKLLAKEMQHEMPKNAEEVKPRSVGAKVLAAYGRLAAKKKPSLNHDKW
jgi:hypothetical protein